MDTVVVLEVLDRFGKVSERHRLDHFPFIVGRSYHNDLILDDNYVSPEHLVIDLDDQGDIEVRDNDSTNGLFTLHPLRQHQRVSVDDNTRIRIGHTDLRFRFPDHPIKDTVVDRSKPSRVAMIATNTLLLPLVWALTAAALFGLFYVASTDEVVVNTLLREVLKVFIFIAAWAFAWSVASKITTHRFFYAFHGIWISALIVLSYLIDRAGEYAEFMLVMDGTARVISDVAELLLLALLFYGHLRYSSTFPKRKARIISATTAVILIGLTQMVLYLGQPEFTNRPQFSRVVKPPQYLVGEPLSVEAYFDQLSVEDFDSLRAAAPAAKP